MLSGSNFKEWRDNLEIVLGYLDLDYALQAKDGRPAEVNEKSSDKEQTHYAKWMRSNRLCLRVIQKPFLKHSGDLFLIPLMLKTTLWIWSKDL